MSRIYTGDRESGGIVSSRERRAYTAAALTALLLAGVVVGFIVFVWWVGEQRYQDRTEARLQVCQQLNLVKSVLSDDFDRRIAQAESFKPTADLPAALIQQSIKNMKDTKQRLQPTDCKTFATLGR